MQGTIRRWRRVCLPAWEWETAQETTPNHTNFSTAGTILAEDSEMRRDRLGIMLLMMVCILSGAVA
ncbi:MAG: hypothetical protein RMM06_07300, partial [Armatimonadota bacterium]|nr:hypothetical protein [Armatimonadota bacterium]